MAMTLGHKVFEHVESVEQLPLKVVVFLPAAVQAVGATEQAVQEAQKAMGEARIFLNAKQAAAR